MVLGRSAGLGKRLALGLGAAAIILASSLLLVPSLRDWIREEWYLRRLRSADFETRADGAAKLLEMRSERGFVQSLREPPLIEVLMKSNLGPEHPLLRVGELDPETVNSYLEQALARGELNEADLVRFFNLIVPAFRQMMQDLGLENPPEDLRSLEDLPRFLDAIRRFVEATERLR